MISPFSIPFPGPDELRLAQPVWLLCLLILPVLYHVQVRTEKARNAFSSVRHSSLAWLRQAGAASGDHAWKNLRLLRIATLILALLALAQPQLGRVERQTWSEGIDIVLVLDVSDSMRTPDFVPNRLEVAKEVLNNFVGRRTGDRIGLVLFATTAMTVTPLTLDLGVISTFIDRVRFNILDGNTTAIGMGLTTALAKLRDSQSKSRVVVLLTDGENNAGKIDPLTAAEAARASGIKVYTIGVGTFTSGPNGRTAGVDEKNLTAIAEMTGGRFFLATDRTKLEETYAQIDRLERTKVESSQFDNFNDLAPWLLIPALFLLLIETALRSFRYVRIP
jgi:Ca-activated chloride channel family protein